MVYWATILVGKANRIANARRRRLAQQTLTSILTAKQQRRKEKIEKSVQSIIKQLYNTNPYKFEEKLQRFVDIITPC